MLWLFIAILAYFFGALTHLIDKYLVRKTISNPWVLSFYVALMSGIVIFAIPFLLPNNFHYDGLNQLIIDLITGGIYTLAFLLFFICLKKEDVSRIAPFVGGLTALFIFVLSSYLLYEKLSVQQIIAFCFIIAGSFVLAFEKKNGKIFPSIVFILAAFCSWFFALGQVLSKMSYLNHGLTNGFVWIRLGTVIGGLALLVLPQVRQALIKDLTKSKEKITKVPLLIGGQVSGALNFILFNYAFLIGPIALVNGLQGLQYVLLFLAAWIISLKWPTLIKEKFSRAIIIQKIVSIILIAIGVGIISL